MSDEKKPKSVIAESGGFAKIRILVDTMKEGFQVYTSGIWTLMDLRGWFC